VVQRNREWGLWSVHLTFSLSLLPPQGEDSSHSSPAPAWGPSHGRQSSMNFSYVSLCMYLPRGAVLQKQTAPAWVPHEVTSPASKPAPSGAPLFTGPLVPARILLQCGLPTASQLPLGIYLFGHGVLHGLQVVICSTMDLVGSRGTACLTMVFITGCRGISTLMPGAPPSSLTLAAAELFLSHVLTPLSHCSCHCVVFSP